MKSISIFIFFLIICLPCVYGCAAGLGIAALTTTEIDINNPKISMHSPDVNREYETYNDIDTMKTNINRLKIYKNQSMPIPMDSEMLKEYWGIPDKIDLLDNGNEKWTYFYPYLEQRGWRGVILLIGILPIPIIHPSIGGKDEFSFIIEKNKVISLQAHLQNSMVFGCILAFVPHGAISTCKCGTLPNSYFIDEK